MIRLQKQLRKLPIWFRIITSACLLCNFFQLDIFDIDQHSLLLRILRVIGLLGFALFIYSTYISRNKPIS